MDRWTRLLESKPIPIAEHLREEVGKLLAQDLSGWPPPITELDPVLGARFAPLLEPGYPCPSPAVYAEAFKLARWELLREIEAGDDYLRNRRYQERGLSEPDKLPLLFLSRWLTEQLLGLAEATEGRLKRTDLLDCLDRVARHLPTSPPGRGLG